MSTARIAGRAVTEGVTRASIAYSTAAIAYTTAIARSAVVATVAVATVAIVATATIVTTPTPISVIPRAGANKHATHEPARSVVAVRCARIGIVVVIAP
jgi:hypothetical protein